MRLGRFSKRHDGELAHAESGNMPAWAAGDPRKFWALSDERERANGTLYHEVEFALPRELTQAQQIEAARQLARSICGEQHPYSWGLHDKAGNPHVHLMFSGRQLDGIERDADQFFKRYNAKSPDKGGCRKESSGSARGPEWVAQVRQDWQNIANHRLVDAGQAARIDHRSYKDRGIDKAPGVHLGRKVHRLEKAGKVTWRGTRHRERQHLNSSLRDVRLNIREAQQQQQRREQRAARTATAAPAGDAVYVLDGKQRWKAQILRREYQQEIAAALAARLAFVDRQPDRIAITLKGGGSVIDHGDRLLTKSGCDQEILAAVALAKAKGWKTIHLTGSADFKARAWLEAARAGLQVTGYEPSPDLRAQLAKEKTMLGTPWGTSLTPDAAPDSQANAAARRWADALRQAKTRLEAARQSASVLSLFEYDQQRKKVAAWLDEVERRGVNDDLLWQIGHHQVGDGKKAPDAAKAALEPLYQLRRDEIEGRKQAAEVAHQEQIQRELMAQSKADELNDLMTQPGLSAAQVEQLQQEHRYYTALAAGYDEAEARERSANPNAAPRPI